MEYIFTSPCDINSRTATILQQGFSASSQPVYLEKCPEERQVDGKSLTGLLSLDIRQGDAIKAVFCSEEDEKLCAHRLGQIMERLKGSAPAAPL